VHFRCPKALKLSTEKKDPWEGEFKKHKDAFNNFTDPFKDEKQNLDGDKVLRPNHSQLAQIFLLNDSLIIVDRRNGEKTQKIHRTWQRAMKREESKPLKFRMFRDLTDARVEVSAPLEGEDHTLTYFNIEWSTMPQGSAVLGPLAGDANTSMRFATTEPSALAFVRTCKEQRIDILRDDYSAVSSQINEKKCALSEKISSHKPEIEAEENLAQQKAVLDEFAAHLSSTERELDREVQAVASIAKALEVEEVEDDADSHDVFDGQSSSRRSLRRRSTSFRFRKFWKKPAQSAPNLLLGDDDCKENTGPQNGESPFKMGVKTLTRSATSGALHIERNRKSRKSFRNKVKSRRSGNMHHGGDSFKSTASVAEE